MGVESIDRRGFMRGSAALAGSSLLPAALAAAKPAVEAREAGAAFTTLTAAEARELEAVAARILPTTDTPGAREAGVVHFFDNVPDGQLSGMLDGIRGMLGRFQDGIGERFPGAARFSDLDEADQDAWLEAGADTPFFGMMRTLTIIGFFAMSSYGGNRDRLSWKLIGFEGPGAANPPFGHYDAEYRREKNDGE